MGFVRTALLAGAAAVWATGAWAETLTYTQNAAAGVTITSLKKTDGTALAPAFNNPSAGSFKMTDAAPANLGFGTDFVAWCLDLAKRLREPTDYIVAQDPIFNNRDALDPTNNLNDTQKGNIKNLFDAVYNPAVHGSATQTGTSNASAAFQVALWEMAYEKGDDGVGAVVARTDTGSFRISGNAENLTEIAGLATSYISTALGYVGPSKYNVFYLKSTASGNNASQNLVTITPVPLPAAGFLLIGGLGALAMVRRRREAATA